MNGLANSGPDDEPDERLHVVRQQLVECRAPIDPASKTLSRQQMKMAFGNHSKGRLPDDWTYLSWPGNDHTVLTNRIVLGKDLSSTSVQQIRDPRYVAGSGGSTCESVHLLRPRRPGWSQVFEIRLERDPSPSVGKSLHLEERELPSKPFKGYRAADADQAETIR